MIAKEDYIEPLSNGRPRRYGFEALDIGDQMRIPLLPGEDPYKARTLASSAAICWTKLKPERLGMKFTSMARGKYVLIERLT